MGGQGKKYIIIHATLYSNLHMAGRKASRAAERREPLLFFSWGEMAGARVGVFGSVQADLVLRPKKLPNPGETVASPHELAVVAGGKGANQAAAAAVAGGLRSEAALAGCVGSRDEFKEPALAGLREAGVRMDALRESEWGRRTGVASVAVDDSGQNQIVVSQGANLEAAAEQVDLLHLREGSVLLLQMEVDPAENWRAAGRAKSNRNQQQSVCAVLNVAPAPSSQAELPLAQLERLIDVVVVNELEAVRTAHVHGLVSSSGDELQSASAIAQQAGAICIVSLGSAGAVAFEPRNRCRWSVPALSITPVDSSGAGDAFIGALCSGLEGGEPLSECLKLASAAGSLACEERGTQQSVPQHQRVQAAAMELTVSVDGLDSESELTIPGRSWSGLL